jgi:hypothetical protein
MRTKRTRPPGPACSSRFGLPVPVFCI